LGNARTSGDPIKVLGSARPEETLSKFLKVQKHYETLSKFLGSARTSGDPIEILGSSRSENTLAKFSLLQGRSKLFCFLIRSHTFVYDAFTLGKNHGGHFDIFTTIAFDKLFL